jgi:dTDP-glucose pyrophosphorylase
MNPTENIWRKAVLPQNATVEQAINNLNEAAIKIVLVVNEAGELVGTISDGDIRRGLLKGIHLKSSISNIVHRNPLVVPPEMARDMVRQLMLANKIQQIPAVDEHRRVVGLHLWDDITATLERPNIMVIMAGGQGIRLRPHTEHCPKPMLSVAGKPMLEHIIDRAIAEGFRHFVLAVHYLGNVIEKHFGNGEHMGIRVDYLREHMPLGTAGALSLLNPAPEQAFVVTNGDVITDIKYGQLLDFHNRHGASATMAVRVHEWQYPFGVVQTKGMDIVGFEEKPTSRSHINAGVYVLDPNSLRALHHDERCDMPTLFERLHTQSKRIIAYPMHEPWLDVGRPDDLSFANQVNSH